MDIISYLLELIETRKTVGISSFGTLYKKKIPGRYDPETHSFLPPKYEIAFSTEVTEDQDLVNLICEKRSISIESANYYLKEFVAQIQAQLADHQHADFSPLGELKLINDQIVLESSKTIEIDFDFYGLPSVAATVEESLLVEVEEPNEEIEEIKPNLEEQTDDQPVYDEISEVETVKAKPSVDEHPTEVNNIQELNEKEERVDIETTTTSTPTEITDPLWKPTVIKRYEYDDEDEEENTGRGMRIFLKILLALFIIIAVAGTLVYFLYPDLFYSLKENFSNQPAESGPTVMIDADVNPKLDSPITDSLKKTIVFTSVAKDSVTNIKPPITTTVYEVIGSAMKTQKKVDEVISNLSKRGISAKKMEAMPGRLIKISLGTFTDFNLAKKFQDSLKIKLKNPEIYIQTIKPKN